MGETATLPDVDAVEALDFEVSCDVPPCDSPADWMGRGTCPYCTAGLFRLPTGELVPIALFCEPHYHKSLAKWEAKLERKPSARCSMCKRVRTADQMRTRITWQRIR